MKKQKKFALHPNKKKIMNVAYYMVNSSFKYIQDGPKGTFKYYFLTYRKKEDRSEESYLF